MLATRLTPQLLLPVLQQFPKARRWWVAYSGGVDSHVLLQLCQQFLAEQGEAAPKPELHALHVNHQLQRPADQWAAHCRQQAQLLGVAYSESVVSIESLPRKSLEDQARQARYQAFEGYLESGDVLLLGHHCDDQAETLMMRMLRGSGSQGLGAMPLSRELGPGVLYRPLLSCSRQQIEQYAREQPLSWVDDPSNEQHDFDRNFLRHQLLPVLAERWPNYAHTFSRSAALSHEANQLNRELAHLDVERLGLIDEQGQLRVSPLKTLSDARLRNVLRYWLQCLQLPMPSEAQLAVLVSDVIHARDDACPELNWSAVSVRRSRGTLVAGPSLADFERGKSYHWDARSDLDMQGAGRLCAVRSAGKGLARLELIQQEGLTVKFRQGGEVCRPAGRGGSRKLKKLLQELAVPYWLRDRVPLVFWRDQLIAVADLVIDERWQAGPDEQGLLLEWNRP